MEKLVELSSQAMTLFQTMEIEKAQRSEERKDFKDRPNKTGIELKARSVGELKLQNKLKALKIWRENANTKAFSKKKRAEKKKILAKAAIKK